MSAGSNLRSTTLPLHAGLLSAALLAGCSGDNQDDDAVRALFVVSNIEHIPAPGGGERSSGVWFSEVVHPYLDLSDSDGPRFDITLASPDGGRAAIDAFSVKLDLDVYLGGGPPDAGDADNERFLADPQTGELVQTETVSVDGATVTSYSFSDTVRLADVDTHDYDVVFYAGGNAAPFQFVDDEQVHRVASEMYEAGKLVTAVCHGSAALLDVTRPDGEFLVAGRTVTGFSTAEEEALGQREVMPVLLEEAFPLRGATYVAAEPFTEHVIVDGRLITGQQPASGHGVGAAIVSYFSDPSVLPALR